jgi:DNA/RNA-binding domain of Phe-tRNA-synthetase-like protein
MDMALFAVAPELVRVSLSLTDLDAARAAAAAAALLARAGAASRGRVPEDARLAAWPPVYGALGFPADVVSPPAALLAWAATPAGVPSQGPVLDVVNAFSLQHLVPVAAYDLAAAVGDLWLRPSRGIEVYMPLGGGGPATPELGELVLADSADQVLARHWHGAPGRLFVPTAAARSLLVHLDLLAPLAERAAELGEALAGLLTGFLGGVVTAQHLVRSRAWVEWGA